MNKKTIAGFVIMPVLIVLGGCAGNSSDGSKTTQNASVQETTQLPVVDDAVSANTTASTPMVDTGQDKCYNSSDKAACPKSGSAFFGQDAQYSGNQPSYTDNSDGTITDNVTGLMWQQGPGAKMNYSEINKKFSLAGHTDWRVPTIKELYTLMDFRGTDPSGLNSGTTSLTPFINSDIFDFEYGDESDGSRLIDSQWITSNIYKSKVMNGSECFFGVNFADGRIKCYPTAGRNSGYFLIHVRGEFKDNSFKNNGDGTITDNASDLVWQQSDSLKGMNFKDSLNYCEKLTLADHSDWRLPNVKELQFIVDYSRSPDTTNSPAIDPKFKTTQITNEAGQKDYPYFWSSTTHASYNGKGSGAYVSFGRALGYMNNKVLDVHGAGAQRSDPKNISSVNTGDRAYESITDANGNKAIAHGPQGDIIRGLNYARCVRGGALQQETSSKPYAAISVSSTGGSPTDGAPSGSQQQQDAQGGQPPQEAVDACSGSSSGATCSIDTPNGTRLSGTCGMIQGSQGSLACKPNGGPPPMR